MNIIELIQAEMAKMAGNPDHGRVRREERQTEPNYVDLRRRPDGTWEMPE